MWRWWNAVDAALRRDEGRRPQGRVGVGSRGSVTAETALALPALVVVLAALVATGQVVMAQLGCTDAARAGARAAARGDAPERVLSVAGQLAPRGSQVHLRAAGRSVSVTVAASVQVPFPAPVIGVRATSVVERELP